MTRMTGPDCAVICNLLNTERERENGEEDTPMLGYTDARRLGGIYGGGTEPIPLR